MANSKLTAFVAAMLSDAAYTPVGTQATAASGGIQLSDYGWTDITLTLEPSVGKYFDGSPQDYTNEFRVFENQSTKQLVMAFKGSKQIQNFISDLDPTDLGYSQYMRIRSAAKAYLSHLQENYPEYTIIADGHSLGGSMAQSFAVENGLAGYGQNSLPIPPAFIANYSNNNPGRNFQSDLAFVRTSRTFDETNLAGDIATFTYSTVFRGTYIDLEPTEIASPFPKKQAAAFAMSLIPGMQAAGGGLAFALGVKAHLLSTMLPLIQSPSGSTRPVLLNQADALTDPLAHKFTIVDSLSDPVSPISNTLSYNDLLGNHYYAALLDADSDLQLVYNGGAEVNVSLAAGGATTYTMHNAAGTISSTANLTPQFSFHIETTDSSEPSTVTTSLQLNADGSSASSVSDIYGGKIKTISGTGEMEESTYVNGIIHTRNIVHADGSSQYTDFDSEGRPEVEIEYHLDGSMASRYSKNGLVYERDFLEADGRNSAHQYYTNGQLGRYREQFADGSQIDIKYYPSGDLQQNFKTNADGTRVATAYRENGDVWLSLTVGTDGVERSTHYYVDGTFDTYTSYVGLSPGLHPDSPVYQKPPTNETLSNGTVITTTYYAGSKPGYTNLWVAVRPRPDIVSSTVSVAPDGSSVTKTYSPDGLLFKQEETLANGTAATTTYFPNGRTLRYSSTSGSGEALNMSYSALGELQTYAHTAADTSSEQYTYHADGSSSGRITLADGSYYTFNDDGQGHTSRLHFDSGGYLTDPVLISESGILAPNVRHAILTGSGNLAVTGNDLDNTITANTGDDTLVGGAGNDTLIAGSGNSRLEGGAGNNTYVIPGGHGNTILSATSNTDTIMFGTGIDASTLAASISSANGQGTVSLQSLVGGTVTFAEGSIQLVKFADGSNKTVAELLEQSSKTLYSAVNVMMPEQYSRLILTGSANLTATGNSTAHTIYANNGNSTLIAGSGHATLVGGTGDDTFVINKAEDIVIETAGGGNNTVVSSVSITLAQNVQNLVGSGSGPLRLTGNAGTHVITAGSGVNTLIAGAGQATLIGGSGSNTFVINKETDVVIAQAGAVLNAIETSVSYAAPEHVGSIAATGAAVLTLTGNSTAHVLSANSAGTTLIAGSGNATLLGAGGNDTLYGGGAADVLDGGGGEDTLDGGSGDDMLSGQGGNDVLAGGAGNDTLRGGASDDTLSGGAGDDLYQFDAAAGHDWIQDWCQNGQETDRVQMQGLNAAQVTVAALGNDLVLRAGADTSLTISGYFNTAGGIAKAGLIQFDDGTVWNSAAIRAMLPAPVATEQDDVLIQFSAALLDGLGGNDTMRGVSDSELLGGAGNDDLSAAPGATNVTLRGGSGADQLHLDNAANARLFGDGGNDVVFMAEGDDAAMDGGAGGDSVILIHGNRAVLHGGEGDDYVQVSGGDRAKLFGDAGDDFLLVGGGDYHEVSGGDGADQLQVNGGTYSVLRGDAGDDRLTVNSGSYHTLEGGDGRDRLAASGEHHLLSGGLDDDEVRLNYGSFNLLTGDQGNDTMSANGNSNVLDGGEGDDAVTGGGGDDNTLRGGIGADVVQFGGGVGNRLEGGAGNDDVRLGGGNNNTLAGGSGDDTLTFGGGHANLLQGGDGLDILTVQGGQSNLLDGGNGNDQLVSLAQRSALWGGSGDDRLQAADAADFLYGGSGNDTIVTGAGEDVIAYNEGDGQDLLQSSGGGKTLSLGSGVGVDAVTLARSGDDLVLGVGTGSVTLEDWYLVTEGPKQVTQLQWILDGGAAYDPAAPEAWRDNKIAAFDFAAVVADFDQALAANPALNAWHISNALSARFTSGSDTSALAGELAVMAGRQPGTGLLDPLSASAALDSSDFGKQRQAVTLGGLAA